MKLRAVCLSCLSCLCLVGCTTFQTITSGSNPDYLHGIVAAGLVKRGDHLRVQTADHRFRNLTVVSTDADTLTGTHESIPFDQVVTIEKRHIDGARTLVLVVLVVGVAVGVAAAVTLRHGVGLPAGAS